jgi:hypothetical protein
LLFENPFLLLLLLSIFLYIISVLRSAPPSLAASGSGNARAHGPRCFLDDHKYRPFPSLLLPLPSASFSNFLSPVPGSSGDVLDSQGEQVGESTTRLRMPAEGSHFEVAGWEERSGEWGESTDLVHGLATPGRCASHRGLEGDGKLRNSCTVPFQLGLWALR